VGVEQADFTIQFGGADIRVTLVGHGWVIERRA